MRNVKDLVKLGAIVLVVGGLFQLFKLKHAFPRLFSAERLAP